MRCSCFRSFALSLSAVLLIANASHAQSGACCFPTSMNCQITLQSSCPIGFRGIGTSCNPNPCAGACCHPGGSCSITTSLGCVFGGNGVYRGGGTNCGTPCPIVGACCFISGTCTTTTEANCSATYSANQTCAAVNCQVMGACCTTGGTCALTLEGDCSGNFSPAQPCANVDCFEPGACCGGFACRNYVRHQCPATASSFIAGEACQPLNACCPADFNYSESLTVQDIFDFLAAYFGADPRADFNGSGGTSVQDIFDFLAAYFAGCA